MNKLSHFYGEENMSVCGELRRGAIGHRKQGERKATTDHFCTSWR